MTGHVELIDRYCEVWGDPDSDSRAAKFSVLLTEDVTYTDPTVHAAGVGELLAHIESVQRRRAGSKVVRTGGVDLHHGTAHFAWQAIDANGAVLREGIDIVFLTPDGSRLERIIGFFAPFATRED
jgi:hypothetical protein